MLDNIGFYTLTENRVRQLSPMSPMWRCEILLTDRCNFKCPYCRGFENFARDCIGDLPLNKALRYITYWIGDGLQNIRFSGGEPTLHSGLTALVAHCKERGVERIAVSTNGSASKTLYDTLLYAGVNDFSISLDACCGQFGDKMAGVGGQWEKVIDNIRYLAKHTYVTIGMVVLPSTLSRLVDNIVFASSLGVADIRIISAAQWNNVLDVVKDVPQSVLDKHPILKYRVNHFKANRNVRGLRHYDSTRCALVLDDSVIADDWHFPCVIYLREGGQPIGKVSHDMRKSRIEWSRNHATHEDKICSTNCLDVCIDYNNFAEWYHQGMDW